jgi:hypothetical protein
MPSGLTVCGACSDARVWHLQQCEREMWLELCCAAHFVLVFSLRNLNAGQAVVLCVVFNTPCPGTFPVAPEVVDASESMIASSFARLRVLSSCRCCAVH